VVQSIKWSGFIISFQLFKHENSLGRLISHSIFIPHLVAIDMFNSWEVVVSMDFSRDIPPLAAITPFNSWEVVVSMDFSRDIPPLAAITPFNSWEVIFSMQLPRDIPALVAINTFNSWEVTITMNGCVKIMPNVFVAVFDCVDKRLPNKSLGAWAGSPFSYKGDQFTDSEPCKR
jgi:hypothetical protein